MNEKPLIGVLTYQDRAGHNHTEEGRFTPQTKLTGIAKSIKHHDQYGEISIGIHNNGFLTGEGFRKCENGE